ncbi:hypothetical protein ADIWIN_0851 [Winogradskyella psychrotolerans RS-3]|uniref:Uncharacterized protein n=1 Tax=Winogradskyella psychrotolerans RS-3 TaxID=641526 RepID=S7VV45_9FLAO|nr:hypothetical protein [Winogradskyella psychrotolerans]EPR74140.1 hypothetical protein ADIWIN_0851 [Winogradskyella psychrotolerans RS-3]
MNIRFLVFSLLIYCNIYSQNLEKENSISVMLMNCYEGSEMDETKIDFSDYFAVYEKEKYLITNFEIKKYDSDSIVQPKFLIKGLDSIKGSTNGKWIDRKMYPGETIIFSVPNSEDEENSRSYSIYIKGELIETENNEFPYFKKIENYELRVAFGKTNESIEKMHIPSFPSGGFEGGIYLYWIGDLNGDNRLDMLVGTSTHYAGIELIFYLSDKTDKELFIKHKVGSCSSC